MVVSISHGSFFSGALEPWNLHDFPYIGILGIITPSD